MFNSQQIRYLFSICRKHFPVYKFAITLLHISTNQSTEQISVSRYWFFLNVQICNNILANAVTPRLKYTFAHSSILQASGMFWTSRLLLCKSMLMHSWHNCTFFLCSPACFSAMPCPCSYFGPTSLIAIFCPRKKSSPIANCQLSEYVAAIWAERSKDKMVLDIIIYVTSCPAYRRDGFILTPPL